uniref:Uncharacterized protein n=1 Tax=Zea mays TaxID=4577 RepID=A0A804NC68_MAIZE
MIWSLLPSSSLVDVDAGGETLLLAKMSPIVLAADGNPPQVSRISCFIWLTVTRSTAFFSWGWERTTSMKIAQLALSTNGRTRYKQLFLTIASAACSSRLVTITRPPLPLGSANARRSDKTDRSSALRMAFWGPTPTTSEYQLSMCHTSSNTMRNLFPSSCSWTAIVSSVRLSLPFMDRMASSSCPRAMSIPCKTSLRLSAPAEAVRDMHIHILGKKRPFARGLLNRSCASTVFPMPPMPTMPTPLSFPAPQSLNAMDSSSASCWSNPWILLPSSQDVVQRSNPAAASSCDAAALPPESFSTHSRTLRLTAVTLFLVLGKRQASDWAKHQRC